MKKHEKKNYIDAVLCLSKRKAISGYDNTVNRFDDHHAVHNVQTPDIHFVGHFLLWHRYFLATYEKALRTECGYKGAQPYWDWSLDADPKNTSSTAWFNSPVFDPKTGFGGNGAYVEHTPQNNPFGIPGATGGGCVQDGPFTEKAFTPNYPSGPECLRRDFIPWIINSWADPAVIAELMKSPDYTTFAFNMEGIPSFDVPAVHGSGHFGVGGVLGQLGNVENSPADPLFYLHHGNLDYIFWKWQQMDLKTRLNQVGGPVKSFGYGGENVTLDFKVNMGPLAGDATLGDLLNTKGKTLCYTY
ncbi:monooxygenase [Sporormia fimetaria CBS 119925]|uniref:Monooxygenase n=1 Tax=Sporormia fimetaria CBS 119925 TaxID=1340428 RepID=A0A6A6V5W2_9PLEO|nr:monooxygenase [Sporormia fimetaria CBS 119925]